MAITSDMITCPKCGNRCHSWAAKCEKCGSGLSLTMSDASLQRRAVQQQVRNAPPPKGPITMTAHLLSGWPLILVFIGGAIGGALGALAYGINISLYKSNLPGVLKVILNLLVGMAAIGIWLAIAFMLKK